MTHDAYTGWTTGPSTDRASTSTVLVNLPIPGDQAADPEESLAEDG